MELPTSQDTVEVAPTAAVACVPRDPTMAVSMYCTAVCISCSSMVGQARERMTAIISLLSLSGFVRMILPFASKMIFPHYTRLRRENQLQVRENVRECLLKKIKQVLTNIGFCGIMKL